MSILKIGQILSVKSAYDLLLMHVEMLVLVVCYATAEIKHTSWQLSKKNSLKTGIVTWRPSILHKEARLWRMLRGHG